MAHITTGKEIDGASLAHKTPVSWLHEICTRNNVTPKYDLLQVEGAVHEPIFKYRLTLESNGKLYEETGSGRSKKEAKHNTARAMLRSMEVVAPHELFEMEDKDTTSAILALEEGPDQSRAADDSDSNPVGILQELCMKMKYPPPIYEVEGEEGLPHERLFAMACRVGEQFVEIGKGKSKKLAKRAAAANMAQRIKSMPLETPAKRVYEDDDDLIISRMRSLKKSTPSSKRKRKKKSKKPGTETNNENEEPSRNEPLDYKTMAGPYIDTLRDPSSIIEDPILFVKKLGIEHGFEAMYITAEDLSSDNKHQILVQITLDPPIVLTGEGSTFREAKRAAARDVISYFTQMTHKSKKDIQKTAGPSEAGGIGSTPTH